MKISEEIYAKTLEIIMGGASIRGACKKMDIPRGVFTALADKKGDLDKLKKKDINPVRLSISVPEPLYMCADFLRKEKGYTTFSQVVVFIFEKFFDKK